MDARLVVKSIKLCLKNLHFHLTWSLSGKCLIVNQFYPLNDWKLFLSIKEIKNSCANYRKVMRCAGEKMSFKRGLKALVTGKYRFGQLWNWYKAHHMPWGLDVKHDPPRLGIFLTTKCNMKCDFCLTHSTVIEDNEFKYQGSEDMSFDTFKDILNRFPNTLIVSFIGNGEPILNRNIYDMVKYARKKKKGQPSFQMALSWNALSTRSLMLRLKLSISA